MTGRQQLIIITVNDAHDQLKILMAQRHMSMHACSGVSNLHDSLDNHCNV